MWTDRQFWLDSTWRSFRTFCQSMAGLLLTVQTANQLTGVSEINVPWYGYIYSSGVAALISLLQSVDRERAVDWVEAETEPAVADQPTMAPSEANYIPPAALASGCGADLR